MTKKYNPYEKYSSSTNVALDSIVVEEWKCELVEANHPALRRRASLDPFGSNVDWKARQDQMLELMRSKLGMGLAAPQIGSSYNMFVMTHSQLGDIGVYKPEILESQGEVVIEEGCLTWPLLFLKITRPEQVRVRYTKYDGVTQVETWMDGMDARCFLHEYDHLQGTVFLEHVSDYKLRRAKDKRDKTLKKISRKLR
jgi:peptide deformylase